MYILFLLLLYIDFGKLYFIVNLFLFFLEFNIVYRKIDVVRELNNFYWNLVNFIFFFGVYFGNGLFDF